MTNWCCSSIVSLTGGTPFKGDATTAVGDGAAAGAADPPPQPARTATVNGIDRRSTGHIMLRARARDGARLGPRRPDASRPPRLGRRSREAGREGGAGWCYPRVEMLVPRIP